MDLLDGLKISLLNFYHFFMIYIFHKILVLLKNNIFKCFLRSIIHFYNFFLNFLIAYNDEKSKA